MTHDSQAGKVGMHHIEQCALPSSSHLRLRLMAKPSLRLRLMTDDSTVLRPAETKLFGFDRR